MNIIQENILIGSILGDGNLALYGRSKNAYYREHGSPAQNDYRKWKAQQLEMTFTEQYNQLRSKSLPIYTNYYHMYYINKIKTVTEDNIKLLNHPIGLMCLYFDDGSLVIDKYKRKNGIHIFPRIYLYTQSFSKKGNEILIRHIKNLFDIEFNLKKVPNGSGYCLNLNKRDQIAKFISLIEPYAKDINCMRYKINISKRLDQYKKEHLSENIIIDPNSSTQNKYTKVEVDYIKSAYYSGIPQKIIANELGRSYYSISDKIRRIKKDANKRILS